MFKYGGLMKKRMMLAALILLLCTAFAFAEEAQDISAACSATTSGTMRDTSALFDRAYKTKYTLRPGGVLEFASDEAISGVYLQYFEVPYTCDIRVQQNGEWVTVASTGPYLSDWVPLPEGTNAVQLVNASRDKIYLSELTLFGAGDRPAYVPQWETLADCDLMLVVAHPDDEHLWFGGLLPTYACERGLDVQVVYVVPTTARRKLELLDGLWHVGVTAYPVFLNMPDLNGRTLSGQYEHWSANTLNGRLVRAIRQYKPEVLVTHDFKGEYGHGAHKAAADAASKSILLAANPKKFTASAEDYGVWTVSKMYVHLYAENPIQLDWTQPLNAFGGKDGLTVATEGLACHVSQVNSGWTMEDSIKYDNSKFGLYYTTVGPDVLCNDFMENIPLD